MSTPFLFVALPLETIEDYKSGLAGLEPLLELEAAEAAAKRPPGRPRKLTDEERAEANRQRVQEWRLRQKNISPECTAAMHSYNQWVEYVDRLKHELQVAKQGCAQAKQHWNDCVERARVQAALDAAVGKGEQD